MRSRPIPSTQPSCGRNQVPADVFRRQLFPPRQSRLRLRERFPDALVRRSQNILCADRAGTLAYDLAVPARGLPCKLAAAVSASRHFDRPLLPRFPFIRSGSRSAGAILGQSSAPATKKPPLCRIDEAS